MAGISMMFEKKEQTIDKADLIVNDALAADEPQKPLLNFKQLIRKPEIYMLTILYSFFNIGSFKFINFFFIYLLKIWFEFTFRSNNFFAEY